MPVHCPGLVHPERHEPPLVLAYVTFTVPQMAHCLALSHGVLYGFARSFNLYPLKVKYLQSTLEQGSRTVENPRISFDSPQTDVQSPLGIEGGFVPGPPVDTRIWGRSSPFYKMA